MGFPKEKIAIRLIKIRKEVSGSSRGSQKRFAEKVLQIPYNTWRDYEKNRNKTHDLDFLQEICDRFDYRIEWLLLGQDPPKKS